MAGRGACVNHCCPSFAQSPTQKPTKRMPTIATTRGSRVAIVVACNRSRLGMAHYGLRRPALTTTDLGFWEPAGGTPFRDSACTNAPTAEDLREMPQAPILTCASSSRGRGRWAAGQGGHPRPASPRNHRMKTLTGDMVYGADDLGARLRSASAQSLAAVGVGLPFPFRPEPWPPL